MRYTVGYQYTKSGDVSICVEWICSKCNQANKKLVKMNISGSTKRGVYAPKEGVEEEVTERLLSDFKNKLNRINTGKYVNIGLDDCICKGCHHAEAWSFS